MVCRAISANCTKVRGVIISFAGNLFSWHDWCLRKQIARLVQNLAFKDLKKEGGIILNLH